MTDFEETIEFYRQKFALEVQHSNDVDARRANVFNWLMATRLWCGERNIHDLGVLRTVINASFPVRHSPYSLQDVTDFLVATKDLELANPRAEQPQTSVEILRLLDSGELYHPAHKQPPLAA